MMDSGKRRAGSDSLAPRQIPVPPDSIHFCADVYLRELRKLLTGWHLHGEVVPTKSSNCIPIYPFDNTKTTLGEGLQREGGNTSCLQYSPGSLHPY